MFWAGSRVRRNEKDEKGEEKCDFTNNGGSVFRQHHKFTSLLIVKKTKMRNRAPVAAVSKTHLT
jgi:hypothetical protein